jgi:hypothetical protein
LLCAFLRIDAPRRADVRVEVEGKEMPMQDSPTDGRSAVIPLTLRTAQAKGTVEGGVLGQLVNMAYAEPERFRQVAADVSRTLRGDASRATGGRAAFLKDLADRFGRAAQTGAIAALRPKGAGRPIGRKGRQVRP